MKNYKTNAYLLLSLSFAVCSPGWATEENSAQLKSLQGTVMVNRGAGYVQAASGMALHGGDRILVLAGGHASIVYNPACVVELKANSMASVLQADDCGARQQQIRQLGPYYAAAIGIEALGEGDAGQNKEGEGEGNNSGGSPADGAADPEIVFAGMSMNELIVVGVGVGAGLGVVVASGGSGGGGGGNGAISPE